MTTERRRGLVISPEFPYPLISGGTQRTFHLLKALSQTHQLDLLSFSENPETENRQALDRLCEQIQLVALPHHPKRPVAFLRRNLSRAIRGINPLIDRFSDPPLRQAVSQWLGSHRYDLVFVEHSWIAHYIREIKASQNRDATTVLDAHNVESDLWKQYYDRPNLWWYKPVFYRYWRSAEEYERRYLSQFDLLLAVSKSDAGKIARLAPDATVSLIPNGIELPPDDGGQDAWRHSSVIGFIGSLEYLPNRLGLQWFVTHVWPQIKERVLDAQLLIIGRGDAAPLARLCRADDRIRLAGYVENLAPHLNRISLMIAPMWHGGGTRIKILEAWAHGITVVSTSKGAEGLDCAHMENIWIADNAADFATAIVYLLSDPESRLRLSRAARQLAKKYAWPTIEEQLREALGNSRST